MHLAELLMLLPGVILLSLQDGGTIKQTNHDGDGNINVIKQKLQ